jgi:HEPN domain-containing protein
MHPKQTEIACYLSQQCAETALKGFLFYRDIDPPRIHDLAGLCRLCMVQDPSFQLILPECERLNPYGVNLRYPNELAIDDTIAKTAIERAQKIYDFCMANVLTAEDEE